MTIYALSSGPGMSGIAVIRVSGPETKIVIREITKDKIRKNQSYYYLYSYLFLL